MHDLAEAADQVDVEVVCQAAGGSQIVRRGADAPGEAGDANAATSECLARERDVLGRGPAPVEMAEPQVDRVEPGAGDRREKIVEARREGLERLERRVRRVVEWAPLGRGAVAELPAT